MPRYTAALLCVTLLSLPLRAQDIPQGYAIENCESVVALWHNPHIVKDLTLFLTLDSACGFTAKGHSPHFGEIDRQGKAGLSNGWLTIPLFPVRLVLSHNRNEKALVGTLHTPFKTYPLVLYEQKPQ